MNDEDTISWKIPCLGNLWMNMDSHKKEKITLSRTYYTLCPNGGVIYINLMDFS